MQPLTEPPISQLHSYLNFNAPWYFNEPSFVVHRNQTKTTDTAIIPSKVFDMLPQRYTQSAAPSMRRIEVNHDGSKSAPSEREWKRALREKRDMDKQSDFQTRLLNRRNKIEPMKAEPVKRNKKYDHVKSKVDSNLQFEDVRHEQSPRSHYRTSPIISNDAKEQTSPRAINKKATSEISDGRTRSAVIWRPGSTSNAKNEEIPKSEEHINKRRVVSAHPSYSNGHTETIKTPVSTYDNSDRIKSAISSYEQYKGNDKRTSPAVEIEKARPQSYSKATEPSITIEVDVSRTPRPYSYRSYNATLDNTTSIDKIVETQPEVILSQNLRENNTKNESIKQNNNNSNSMFYENLYDTYLPSYYQNNYNTTKVTDTSIVNDNRADNINAVDIYKNDFYFAYLPSLGTNIKTEVPSPPLETTKPYDKPIETLSPPENTQSRESRSLSLPNLRSASGSTYYYKLRHQEQDSNRKYSEKETDYGTKRNDDYSPIIQTKTRDGDWTTKKDDDFNTKKHHKDITNTYEVNDTIPYPSKLSYARKYLHDSIDFNTLVPVEFDTNKPRLSDTRNLSQSEMSLPAASEATNRMYSWLDSMFVNQTKKVSPRNKKDDGQNQKREKDYLPRFNNKIKNISSSMPANLNYAGVGNSRSILKKKKKVNISLENNRVYVYTPEYDMPVIRWPGSSYL